MESINGTIHVTIVEDDRSLREGLSLLISATPGYRCPRTFGSVEEALRGIGAGDEVVPDILLLDIHLPGMLGSDGVKLFRQKFQAMQVLMLTVYAEQDKVFESICNGACGYLLKKTPPARLLEAIREAHEGGAPMSPEIARKVVTLFQNTRQPEKIEEQLTPQEVRLLQLLSDGHSYQSAAGQLNISVNTIRNYIRSIYDKLHVHSKNEAVSKALRSGIIS
ncbi:MAG TPA: response regulator transcription factor [Blastocatellia bacterium]|nr:response regulator transcription factor [Blastocatellia bacterium]HMY71458.1 response regulator transcription factor [Blastocatellia bacterium]HMZ17114.1 response regulator transcription factor [Blastocatellia bacterium]HNG33725.1 response regulator transcription factor [Blastocatellia bacterium]